MPLSPAAEEARRVMTFCNACRYCEGFCAVFPAMELRRAFSGGDLNYLSNLCHNCRDCYYACQYAPPHEFKLNIPKAMAQLRLETYHEFCWPVSCKDSFKHNAFFTTLTTFMCLALTFGAILLLKGKAIVFATHTGPGAFYRVVPYNILVSIALLTALGVLVIFTGELKRFRRGTGGSLKDLLNLRAHAVALSDVLRLKYLSGGGHGCNYPDERFSMLRRWLHHMVFYGFALCGGATATAACYEHFLHRLPPYSLFSLPVLLGSTGGIAMLLGTCGLLYLKSRMDTAPSAGQSTVMDVGFLVLLFMVNLTGLGLLVLRGTSAMGTLLALHLGFVAGLFLTAPYGKLVHAVFRYMALVQNAAEQERDHI